jgi:hypothetical protein
MNILLHADAPTKPALGSPCNGCGVCCAMAPCPLSMLLLRHRRGPCPGLLWQEQRYVCGLTVDARKQARWLPRAWVLRWISAGSGCDCDAQEEDPLSRAAPRP